MFETTGLLMESVRLYYTAEVLSQSAWILGSVDFLGNPLGFFKEVTEGLHDLMHFNIGGMVKNVTHGTFNSAAKVLSMLSIDLDMTSHACVVAKIRIQ